MGTTNRGPVGTSKLPSGPPPPPSRGGDQAGSTDSLWSADNPWQELVEHGKRSGHVLCECPVCGFRQMASYRPASKPWPVCGICHPGYVGGSIRSARGLTRLEPIGTTDVCKHPGQPRTRKELLAAGFVLKGDKELEMYVICSCGAEWWLDFDPPACDCPGDDTESRLELRPRSG